MVDTLKEVLNEAKAVETSTAELLELIKAKFGVEKDSSEVTTSGLRNLTNAGVTSQRPLGDSSVSSIANAALTLGDSAIVDAESLPPSPDLNLQRPSTKASGQSTTATVIGSVALSAATAVGNLFAKTVKEEIKDEAKKTVKEFAKGVVKMGKDKLKGSSDSHLSPAEFEKYNRKNDVREEGEITAPRARM